MLLSTCAVVHLQDPVKGPKQHLYLPITLQEPLEQPHHMTQEAEANSLRNFLSLFPRGKWVGVTTQMRNMLPPKSKESPPKPLFKITIQIGSNNLFFIFSSPRRDMLTCPTPLGP